MEKTKSIRVDEATWETLTVEAVRRRVTVGQLVKQMARGVVSSVEASPERVKAPSSAVEIPRTVVKTPVQAMAGLSRLGTVACAFCGHGPGMHAAYSCGVKGCECKGFTTA